MQWYYLSEGAHGKQQGPVSQETIQQWIASGNIAPQSMVWRQGMPDWLPAGQTKLASFFPGGAKGRLYPQPSPIGMFKLWLWVVIINCAGLILLAPLAIIAMNGPNDLSSLVGYTLVILFFVFIIAGLGTSVMCCILLYQLWCTIQYGQARTTPGKAVGFCFIPFFGLYWIFVAFWGLSKDLNAYAAERGIPAPRISENLGLYICILPFVGVAISFLPDGEIVNWVLSAAHFVMNIIFWRQAVATASAIVKAKS